MRISFSKIPCKNKIFVIPVPSQKPHLHTAKRLLQESIPGCKNRFAILIGTGYSTPTYLLDIKERAPVCRSPASCSKKNSFLINLAGFYEIE